jgi:hypothetical protein
VNLSDPSLWPAGFGPLRFERLDSHSPHREINVFSADGVEVAELLPLAAADGALELGDADETVLALDGCWRLSLIQENGSIFESHVLRVAARETRVASQLTPELATWATLTLLWALAPDKRLRG